MMKSRNSWGFLFALVLFSGPVVRAEPIYHLSKVGAQLTTDIPGAIITEEIPGFWCIVLPQDQVFVPASSSFDGYGYLVDPDSPERFNLIVGNPPTDRITWTLSLLDPVIPTAWYVDQIPLGICDFVNYEGPQVYLGTVILRDLPDAVPDVAGSLTLLVTALLGIVGVARVIASNQVHGSLFSASFLSCRDGDEFGSLALHP